MVDAKCCLFLHKPYSFAKKTKTKKRMGQKKKKDRNFSFFSDLREGVGSYFLSLHSRGGLYSISISLISVPWFSFNVYIKLWVSTFWTKALRNKGFFFGADRNRSVINHITNTLNRIAIISHNFHQSAVAAKGSGVSWSFTSHFLFTYADCWDDHNDCKVSDGMPCDFEA